MTVSTVLLPTAIPGLHRAPTVQDLNDSSALYNLLPESHDQPRVATEHLNNLYLLLKRYNLTSRFGLHLIHRHDKVEAGHISYRNDLASFRGCLAMSKKIEELDLEAIQGHIFRLSPEGQFQAYEYRNGFYDFQDVDPVFFQEFADYLLVNQITELLGLQVLSRDVSPLMCEFVMQNDGTVMLDAGDVKE